MGWVHLFLWLWSLPLAAEEAQAPPTTVPKEDNGQMDIRPQVHDTSSPQLDPFVFSIIKDNEVIAYFRLIVQVMIKDPTLVEDFYRHIPPLRDLIFTDIYSAMCDQWLPPDEPQPSTLKKRVQKVSDQYFGPGKVEVFISHSYLQRYEPHEINKQKPSHTK